MSALTTGVAVKVGSGYLHTITINTKGATSNLLTVYDSLSATGTKLATVDTTVTFGTLVYDVNFVIGLFIVLAAGTAADLTISFS